MTALVTVLQRCSAGLSAFGIVAALQVADIDGESASPIAKPAISNTASFTADCEHVCKCLPKGSFTAYIEQPLHQRCLHR